MVEEDEVIDNYSSAKKQPHIFMEGDCYLRTNEDRLQKYWMVIMSNELYFYRE